jgi:hypothetical protein
VGLSQAGVIGTVNIPITITDNAIALFQAASALGLTSVRPRRRRRRPAPSTRGCRSPSAR